MAVSCWLRAAGRNAARFACCFIFVTFGVAAAEEKPGELSVEVSGLRIVAPFKNADTSLNAFGNRTPGTCVSLLISSTPGNFVQFDRENSEITGFTDDKGKDLLATVGGPKPPQGEALIQQGFSLFPLISKDGNACAVEVTSGLLPDKAANSLKLSGILSMLCATAKHEFVQKDVVLKKDAKLEADGMKLSILSIEAPYKKEDERSKYEPLAVTFRAEEEIDRIAEIKFFNAQGKEIHSRSAGVVKMGAAGTLTVDWTFNLGELADTVTVKIYTWADLQRKRKHFDLTIAAGL